MKNNFLNLLFAKCPSPDQGVSKSVTLVSLEAIDWLKSKAKVQDQSNLFQMYLIKYLQAVSMSVSVLETPTQSL